MSRQRGSDSDFWLGCAISCHKAYNVHSDFKVVRFVVVTRDVILLKEILQGSAEDRHAPYLAELWLCGGRTSRLWISLCPSSLRLPDLLPPHRVPCK